MDRKYLQYFDSHENLLDLISQQLPAALWTTDAELKITFSIGADLQGINLTPNQIVGMSLYDYLGTKDPEFVPLKSHLEALGGKTAAYELNWMDRTFYSHIAPIKNSQGAVVGTIGIALDITDRKLAEDRVKEKADQAVRYQDVLLQLAKMENSNLDASLKKILELDAHALKVERVSIWFFDPEGQEIRCEWLFELSHHEYQSGIILKQRDYPRYFQALEESRLIAADDAQQDPRTKEFKENYLIPHGITSMMDIPIRLRGRMVGILCHEHVGPPREWRGSEQEFAGSIADMVSLTLESHERLKAEEALQRATEELKRSNQELEQFAYVASHDLQEPLHKIVGFSDRLLEICSNYMEEKGKDYLLRIQKAALGMRSFIQDLLRYSRINTSADPFEPVDLNEVIRDVQSNLEMRLEESGGDLIIQPLPVILGDFRQLRQLFQNLISNALKFAQKDRMPKVEIVSLEGEEGGISIIVKDNGIGIETEYLDQIFKPFFRLHGKSEFEGSGIGLAICEKIIQRHGGFLSVSSQKGVGSIFKVTFPYEKI